MVKTITERFDKDGKLVERITVESEEDQPYPYPWHDWMQPTVKYWPHETITTDKVDTGGSLIMNTGGSITVRA
jgi:hypothetical protein